jgi:hypothetical protein
MVPLLTSLLKKLPAARAFRTIRSIAKDLIFPYSHTLIRKHHYNDTALKILSRLYRCEASDPKIQAEVQEIKRVVAITGGSKLTVKEVFSNGHHINRWGACIAFTT